MLLTAPAGYGKSSLIADFIRHSQCPYLWYSLDASDNEPSQFSQYLAYACQQLLPAIPSLSGLSLETLIAKLLQHFTDQPGQRFMVLDDVQWLDSPRILQALDQLLRHLPASLNLILISRSRPRLNLARLELQGKLAELDYQQLAFSHAELTNLVTRELGPQPEDRLQALLNQVDGWIAGLQLILRSYPKTLPRQWQSGSSHQQLANFLSHEILNQLDEDLRHFLTTTAVLDKFDLALAQQLSGISDAARLMQRLQDQQLFLYPLDAEHCWFRYHPLFADTLCQQLARRAPDALSQLHRRAALAWAERGFYPQAVQQALASSDSALLSQLLQQYGDCLLKFDYRLLLERCFELLPPAADRPIELNRLQAWAAFWYEKPEQVEQVVDLSLKQPLAAQQDGLRGELLALKSSALMLNYQLLPAEQSASQALQLCPPNSPGQALALLTLGGVQFKQGQLPTAIRTFQQARHSAESCRVFRLSYYAQYSLARIEAEQGNSSIAIRAYQQAIAYARAAPAEDRPYQDDSWRELACLLCQQGQFEQAEQALNEAQNLHRPKGDYWHLPNHLVAGYLHWCQQQFDRLADTLAQCRPLLHNHCYSQGWLLLFDRLQLLLWQQQQHTEQSRHWYQRQQFSASPDSESSPPTNSLQHQHQHNLLLALGPQPSTIEALEQLALQAQALGLHQQEVEHLALLLSWQPLKPQSLQRLLTCIEQSHSSGCFYGYGASWFRALQQGCESQAMSSKLSQQLTQAFHQQQLPDNPLPAAAQRLGITLKEWQILLLMCQGLSNTDLAEQLHRSPATIKTHIKRLYAKLGVNSRSQAILACQHLH